MCWMIGPGFALAGVPGYSALAPGLGEFVEIHILAAQARVLMWVGFAWLTVGLWLGFDPLTVAWRAALGALVAMMVSGWLLRSVVGVINERMVSDMADRQAQAETAARAAIARPPIQTPRQSGMTAAPARAAAPASAPAPARPPQADPAPARPVAGAPDKKVR